jgi:ABC-type nitrate/sulfonate/bicarbonate transport system substrate-binding protein
MKSRLLFAVLALACAASAYGSPAKHLTRIVLLTDAKAQAEHGGFYEAVALGLYKQRGLNVKIREGGPSANLPQSIAGGAADFVLASTSFVPLDMVRQGVPVRVVMALFQKDPAILTTDPRLDARRLADNGHSGYANLVLVPQRWIDKKQTAVQAFYDATRDGWYHYLHGDPGPANALIKRSNPDMSDTVIAQAIVKMKTYGLVESGDTKAFGIGAMTDLRWRRFFAAMSAQGLYPKTLDYRKAYDLSFMRNAPQYFEQRSPSAPKKHGWRQI